MLSTIIINVAYNFLHVLLCYFCSSEKELEELFSPFGTVTEVRFVLDQDTKKFIGMAFVSFSSPQSAAR
jgi:multiple RNA-binding domain-containing protein 1